MKTTKTTYSPGKGKPERVQFWNAHLRDTYFSASAYRIECVATEFKRWLERLQQQTLRSGLIEFIPVICEELPANYSRLHYCGYIPGGGGANDNPIDPIIVRGRPLPELAAWPQWYPHQQCWHIGFRSLAYSDPLTPGQGVLLKEWFEQQLIAALTPELFDTLREKAIADARANIRAFIKGQEEYLSKLQEIGGAK